MMPYKRVASCDAASLSASMSSELPPLQSCHPPGLAAHKRKFSFPAALHSSLLGAAAAGQPAPELSSARRRFSNVSDAVSRKLSNTIGWRSAVVPTQEVVDQGKLLCGQYMRSRLKRAAMLSRKCGLQRMRTASGLPGGHVVREVFPELASIGQELERMHPKVYTGVARQASASPALSSDKTAGLVLTAVARELFKADVTWGKVVSLFAVAGGLAVDSIRQGHPEYLHSLVDAFGEFVEEELSPWLITNGGWACWRTSSHRPTKCLSRHSLAWWVRSRRQFSSSSSCSDGSGSLHLSSPDHETGRERAALGTEAWICGRC